MRGVGPGGVCEGAGGEADADNVYKGKGGPEAEEGHCEDHFLGRGFGVIDVEIGGCAGPGDGDRELEGEEGEAVRAYCCGDEFRGEFGFGGNEGLESCIEFGTAYAAEDEQGDELWDPGVALIGVEEGHAEDGDEPGDEGDDYYTDYDCHFAAGDGGEDLARYDAGDYCVADH